MAVADIDHQSFQNAFRHFQKLLVAKSGHALANFDEGLPAAWESYKPKLRAYALGLLAPEQWSEADIGSGRILDRTIAAIEIQDSRANLSNNLVFWQNRYGHAHRDHRALLDATLDRKLRDSVERLLFALYRTDEDEGSTFDRLSDLSGAKYPLLAYLYFLKDSDRFMPIQPTGFDRAFAELNVELRTLRQCSWSNYTAFLSVLRQLQSLIADAISDSSVGLIDAHSFCWILATLLKEEAQGTLTPAADKPSAGRVIGGREKSIITLRHSIEQTAKTSKGQLVERIVKRKDLLMSGKDLEAHIEALLDLQQNRCALTGVPFQFHGRHVDKNLLPSPDRIDSSGHYEIGNIQIVCQFVNFWKGSSDNDEFRRLLLLVQESAQPSESS